MAKEKPEKSAKKEKKDKKAKSEENGHELSNLNGVTKPKKEKKSKTKNLTSALLKELETPGPGAVRIDADGDAILADVGGNESGGATVKTVVVPKEALVPFANPLADEKQSKKVFKSVKKAAKNKTLRRGVKEVVKTLRKLPATATSSTSSSPPGVVIIAADISPMDVISHLPVLCEDHQIPYIYVSSRAELGAAGNTKRPTSVVLIARERQRKHDTQPTTKSEEEKEFEETYSDLAKLALKASRSVRI